jgi:hypothetical protein
MMARLMSDVYATGITSWRKNVISTFFKSGNVIRSRHPLYHQIDNYFLIWVSAADFIRLSKVYESLLSLSIASALQQMKLCLNLSATARTTGVFR